MHSRSVALLLLLSLVLLASAFPEGTTCGHDNHLVSHEERSIQKRLHEEVQRTSTLSTRSNEVFRIPVVWHVLTDRDSNRVSRQRIEQEMANLNEWYSGTNQHFNTTDMFSNVVARGTDLNIRFFLAEKDPQGNDFDGIHYIQSPLAESGCNFGNTDNFYTAKGGYDMWPHTEYFNIYTCGIPGGVAGFAYYPGTNPEYDAAVMDFPHIGNGHGGIIAHEAGHWLGLPHTFDQNTCNGDDGFEDTPNTDGPASNWLPQNDRCNVHDANTAAYQRCGGQTVMVRNVMEYNSDQCQSYFSKQQAAHMRNHLASPSSPRSKLPYSFALPPACPTYDCADKTCGPDGCGGVCGICGTYDVCSAQNCVSTIPENIYCSEAEVLPQYTNGYTVSKNNAGVKTGYLVGSCGGAQHNDASLWYKFTAVASGSASVSTAGSSVSAYVDLYTTSNCQSYSCATSGGSDLINGNVVAGNTYYIVVSSYDTTPADLSVTLTMTGSGFSASGPAPPAASQSSSNTPEPTPPASNSPSASRTSNPSASRTPSSSAAPVPSVAGSPAPAPSASSSAAASDSPSRSPSRSATPSPSRSPSRSSSTSRLPSTSPVPPPVCDAAVECPAQGFQCGTASICSGIEVDCGSCSPSFVCNGSNKCTCPQGFTLASSGIKCEADAPTGVPDFSGDFEQVLPVSPAGVSYTATGIVGLNTNTNLLVWTASSGLVDRYNTKQSFNIKATSGTVGIGLHYGQGSGSREHDRIEWRFSNLDGNRMNLRFCMVYYGDEDRYCSDFGSYDFPTGTNEGVTVKVTLSFNDNTGNIVTEMFYSYSDAQGGNYNYNFNGQVGGGAYPLPGSLSYRLSSNGAVLGNLKMATSSALRITLGSCMDDAKFLDIFYALSGANPGTTSVDITARDANGNCGKGATHGKAFVSGFTVVVSSVGVPAAQLTNTFLAAANAPGYVIVSSAAAISGSAGASAAGFPLTAAGSTGAAALAVPGSAAAGAGGGGGGAAGLSGGAIAGIVVGSVGGAVLLVGLTAIVVAAVVVAAVAISRKDSEASAPSDDRRRSVRQTIRGFFGGVDVMNSPGKGHQSISGRSPAMA